MIFCNFYKSELFFFFECGFIIQKTFLVFVSLLCFYKSGKILCIPDLFLDWLCTEPFEIKPFE